MAFARPSLKSEPIRLNRYLASCGCGSRRACDELISSGRVLIDGRVVKDLSRRVEVGKECVECDGRVVSPSTELVYMLMNKPVDVLCTADDPQGRRTVFDLLPERRGMPRLFHVGRLDRDSDGLLLLTNDGDLANRLIHPRYHLSRTYEVTLNGLLHPAQVKQFLQGIEEGGEVLRAISVSPMRRTKDGMMYRLVLKEGKNRQIRRMAKAAGLKVLRLTRTEMGPLSLEGISRGRVRSLRHDEVVALRSAVGM